MFRKILVPLDGLELSERAIPFVKRLLQENAAAVTLFMVGVTPKATIRRRKGPRRPIAMPGGMGAPMSGLVPAMPPEYVETKDQAVERRESEMLAYLQGVSESFRAGEAPVRTAVQFGDAAHEIVSKAERGGFDLIVMSTRGRKGIEETLFGSVTLDVVHSGVAPVLVIPPLAHTDEIRAAPTHGRQPVS